MSISEKEIKEYEEKYRNTLYEKFNITPSILTLHMAPQNVYNKCGWRQYTPRSARIGGDTRCRMKLFTA